jgi:hypothetical protein
MSEVLSPAQHEIRDAAIMIKGSMIPERYCNDDLGIDDLERYCNHSLGIYDSGKMLHYNLGIHDTVEMLQL